MKLVTRHSQIAEVQPGEVYIADLKALNVTTTPLFQIAINGREGAICDAYNEATAHWLAALIEAAGPEPQGFWTVGESKDSQR